MEGEVPIFGMTPVAGIELELFVAHKGHPVAVDLHLVRYIGHPGCFQIQLYGVRLASLQQEAGWAPGLRTRSQLDHPFQHAQRIGHLALVVPELGTVTDLQLKRGSVVGDEDAMVEAHDALAVVQPGEGWRWLPHCVAAEVNSPAHIRVLNRQRLVEEPMGFVWKLKRESLQRRNLWHSYFSENKKIFKTYI